ncbi:DUF3000 family protein [Rathayibacter oskolensis]|uniref:DUF3000 family protein n=1 Tax=Rathayibacter oskolensis TaxID=1891671 RepID=UPI00265EEC83|nr:DUF3000 family protein [Rathayibacter oskolensis]WKK71343.1 DUF3000 family protein [Rathayibacter oskolensis]
MRLRAHGEHAGVPGAAGRRDDDPADEGGDERGGADRSRRGEGGCREDREQEQTGSTPAFRGVPAGFGHAGTLVCDRARILSAVPAPGGVPGRDGVDPRGVAAVRTHRVRDRLADRPRALGARALGRRLAADPGRDSELGTGRFILLYDPEEPEQWGGPFRVVCFAQAPLEIEIGTDPFLAEVAWSWLIDALDVRGATYTAASGTATKVLSTGFGELAAQGDGAQIEIRASWSPDDAQLAAHVEGWGELLCMLAGLPPVSGDGVTSLALRRNTRD